MPYITPERKLELLEDKPSSAGELNYTITKLIVEFLGKNYRYKDINDVLGAIEGAKLEFYRRVVVPYEDNAMIKNGDVYDRTESR